MATIDPATYRYGLASREEAAGLSGKEILERIIDGRFPQPPISRTMSFWRSLRRAFASESGFLTTDSE